MHLLDKIIELKGFAHGAAMICPVEDQGIECAFLHISDRLEEIIAEINEEKVIQDGNAKFEGAVITDKPLPMAEDEVAKIAKNFINSRIKKIPLEELLQTQIESIKTLSRRTVNALTRNNVFTLGDLTKCNESQLLSFKGMGQMGLDDIKEVLTDNGLILGMSSED